MSTDQMMDAMESDEGCPECGSMDIDLYVPPKEAQLSEDYLRGKPERRGEATRNHDHNVVYGATGDRKAAIRAYCAGNKWLEENAKAVGNWD
jgi:hypothetical protein